MTMTSMGAGGAPAADRELVLDRIFDAPRELVFDAWTHPDHIGQWWGPRGFTTTTQHRDVRPGGSWRFIMHGPDGRDWDNLIVYLEVVRPERLVYDHGDGDTEGAAGFHVTVTFAEHARGTHLTMRIVFATARGLQEAMQYGAVEGGNQTLERLAEHVGTLQPAA